MIDKVLKNAVANCAWQDAVNPVQAEQLRQYIGNNNGPVDYDYVYTRFGRKAADAWHDAENARVAFFKAIEEV